MVTENRKKIIFASLHVLMNVSEEMQKNLEKNGIGLAIKMSDEEYQLLNDEQKAFVDKYRVEEDVKLAHSIDEKHYILKNRPAFSEIFSKKINDEPRELMKKQFGFGKFFVPKSIGKVNTRKKGRQ